MSLRVPSTKWPALFLLPFCISLLWAADKTGEKKERKDPLLISLFPLGGQRGTTFEVTIRGEYLQGVREVWLDCPQLTADIRKIQEIVLVKTRFASRREEPGQEIRVSIGAGPEAAIGVHSLRLITEDGLSGPLPLLIGSLPLVAEKKQPHPAPGTAQSLPVPALVSGRIHQDAELDYYAFQAEQGQELAFEVLLADGLLPGAPVHFPDPELFLYDPSGSWFDPQKGIRLEARDESSHLPLESRIAKPRLRHRFTRAGRYLVAVGSQRTRVRLPAEDLSGRCRAESWIVD